jgi:flagellin
MSLGVLNNLNAIYAENSLNNTSSSLSKVLNQLSSGSKINSGADDAAGLSLVDGLQANASALTQSETNATEGVGLLTVADGALSQVTSLLNRAVTLATEASNGTLNSTQDTAANQEYQSILSEISNIGSTTTYNQETVFGSNTDIYTGDSSSAGSSINSLNIRSLSSSNVGDTNGVMSYSTGANNAFINLSSGTGAGAIASANDQLSSTGKSSIDVTYMTGTSTNITNHTEVITVGTGTNYANTAQGLMDAINGSGLGLTASFTTAAAAGTAAVAAAGGTADGVETGIEISGLASGVSGAANGAGTPGLDGTLGTTAYTGGTLTINGKSLTLGTSSTDTIANIAAAVNGGNYGVEMNATTGAITSLTKATITASGLTGGTGWAGSNYTTVAVTEDTTNALSDATTSLASAATPASDIDGTGGTATISYSDAAGQALNNTDLSNQTDAEAALTALNAAISDVAAQDGYIGAQINTLNSVSSVLSTQSENVTSAQNAVQATDYASATSNMSKYEILSQTGIAALAQANSIQQEVTKLLQ